MWQMIGVLAELEQPDNRADPRRYHGGPQTRREIRAQTKARCRAA
jgi:hypothetical protein